MYLPSVLCSPFGVPRAERIRGEGDSGHLGAALHDCLPHDHQSPCRQLRRHRSSVSTTPRLSLPSLYYLGLLYYAVYESNYWFGKFMEAIHMRLELPLFASW
ncbi:hypothetical protein O3P69_016181 [Scylla paramamosain]|uniref:Uncharacterized protein n=1 Tax=Scylla paramamosain TaxID=85552 RepID=A0AAW0SFG6_SCYPA